MITVVMARQTITELDHQSIKLVDHTHGATPMEAWHSIDVYRHPAPKVEWFEAWDGLLTGYWLRC